MRQKVIKHGVPTASFRELLLKGKSQYSWPPSISYFILATFDIAYIIYFLENKLP